MINFTDDRFNRFKYRRFERYERTKLSIAVGTVLAFQGSDGLYKTHIGKLCQCKENDGSRCAKKQRSPLPSCSCACHTPAKSSTKKRKRK